MRLALALALAACSSSHLEHDAEVFCGAHDALPDAVLPELEPYVEQRVKGDDFKAVFGAMRTVPTNLSALTEQFRGLVKRSGVERCATLDWLDGRLRQQR